MLIKLIKPCIYFHFRQVEPLSDNVVANSVQSCMQQRNLRKVEVNAKITFIIWLLEIFSIIVVAVVGVAAGMKEIASVLYLLFYYVILPLVFLTNTSDNKDRLVEFGFLIDLILGISTLAIFSPDTFLLINSVVE